MILETKRLYLREMNQSDFPALCKILQDKEVMYAYEHPFDDTEAHQWLDKQIQHCRDNGFGLWAVILKDIGEMIGQCGLTFQEYKNRQVLEIGYLFQKSYWHCGYAIEAAAACKEYAFDTLNAEEVFSIIRDTNTPSQNVARRNGMTVVGGLTKHYYGMDMPHLVFSVKREQERPLSQHGPESLIRRFGNDDIEKIMDIWLTANKEAHSFISPAYWESCYDMVKDMLPSSEIYIFQEQGQMKGFIGLTGNYISGIFIRSGDCSKGIGKLLLDYTKKMKDTLTLHVYEKNERAAAFYHREGFVITGRDTDENTGEPEFKMLWTRKN